MQCRDKSLESFFGELFTLELFHFVVRKLCERVLRATFVKENNYFFAEVENKKEEKTFNKSRKVNKQMC